MNRVMLFIGVLTLAFAAGCGSDSDGGTDLAAGDSGKDAMVDPGTPDDPGQPNDPGKVDPGQTDPGVSDPGQSDPGQVDPGQTDPGQTDPGQIDPGTTDPGTSDPGTTDPGQTDPGTTDEGNVPANLACVGNVVWPQPATATYEYTYGVEEAISELKVEGATVKICAFSDTECTAPVTQGVTDVDGKVTLTIPSAPQGLDGYVEISGTNLITTLGFFSYKDNEAVYTNQETTYYYMIMSNNVFGMLLGLAGVTADAEKSHLIFSTDDCNFDPAEGFSVNVSNADVD